MAHREASVEACLQRDSIERDPLVRLAADRVARAEPADRGAPHAVARAAEVLAPERELVALGCAELPSQAGVDVTLRNRFGQTAADVARISKLSVHAQLLDRAVEQEQDTQAVSS